MYALAASHHNTFNSSSALISALYGIMGKLIIIKIEYAILHAPLTILQILLTWYVYPVHFARI